MEILKYNNVNYFVVIINYFYKKKIILKNYLNNLN